MASLTASCWQSCPGFAPASQAISPAAATTGGALGDRVASLVTRAEGAGEPEAVATRVGRARGVGAACVDEAEIPGESLGTVPVRTQAVSVVAETSRPPMTKARRTRWDIQDLLGRPVDSGSPDRSPPKDPKSVDRNGTDRIDAQLGKDHLVPGIPILAQRSRRLDRATRIYLVHRHRYVVRGLGPRRTKVAAE